MITIKATIYFENPLWVAIFERLDNEGCQIARQNFYGEPSDVEVYNFILHEYCNLHFGEKKEFKLEIKRMNPKRVQREVRKEMEKIKETSRPSTYAQDYLREELEKNKKVKKETSKAIKEEKKERQFQLKQEKRKEKHRGH